MAFYMTLLSDKTQQHQENEPWSFTTSLDRPVYLQSDTDVCLSEFVYCPSYSLDDTQESDSTIRVFDFLHSDDGDVTWGKMYEFSIPFSVYGSITDLLAYLNEKVWSVSRLREEGKYVFSWNERLKRVWVNFTDTWITVLLEGEVLRRIGAELVKPTKNQFLALGHKKSASHYTYGGQQRDFSPEYREKYDSVCTKLDYFEYIPKIFFYKSLIIYCNIVKDNYIAGR